jgi:hypothetical protein
MMTGVITAIVLLQLPTWPIGRRVAMAAATVAIAARRQSRTRAAAAQPSRIPERAPVPADPRLSLGS